MREMWPFVKQKSNCLFRPFLSLPVRNSQRQSTDIPVDSSARSRLRAIVYMICNQNERNSRKLLVVFLAMITIVAGAAIVLSDNASAEPSVDDAGTAASVSTAEDLSTIIAGIGVSGNDYENVSTIKLTADITVSRAISINKAVTIDGAKADGTGNWKIIDSSQGDAGIYTQNANCTFKNIDFSTTSTTFGTVLNNNGGNTNYEGCNFDCTGVRGAVQDYASSGTVSFKDCVFNGSKVHYNDAGDGVLKFQGCTGVTLAIAATTSTEVTISDLKGNADVQIDDPNTVSRLVLGWDFGNGWSNGAPTVQVSTDMNVNEVAIGADTADPTYGNMTDKTPVLKETDDGSISAVSSEVPITTSNGMPKYSGITITEENDDQYTGQFILENATIEYGAVVNADKITIVGTVTNEGTINVGLYGIVVDGGRLVNEGTIDVTSETSNPEFNIYAGAVENYGIMNLEKLQVGKNAEGTLENSGTITLSNYGEVFENSTIVNSGAFAANGSGVTIYGDGTFENLTNGVVGFPVNTKYVTGVSYDVTLTTDIIQSVTYGSLQNVIVPEGATLTIQRTAVMTINGTLTVLGTLNIEGELVIGSNSGAQMIVDGTVNILSNGTQNGKLSVGYTENGDAQIGTVTVNGSVVVGEDAIVEVADNNALVINGDMNMQAGSVLISAETQPQAAMAAAGEYGAKPAMGVVVSSGATMQISGDISGNVYICNNGSIVVDNGSSDAVTPGSLTVIMGSTDADLSVVSYALRDGASLTVTDDGMVLRNQSRDNGAIVVGETDKYTAVDTIKFTASANSESLVGTLSFTVAQSGNSTRGYEYSMDVAGNVSISYDSDVSTNDRVNVIMDVSGQGVTVNDALTLGAYVVMDNSADLTVAGTITNTATGAQKIQNTGEITVTGLITSSNSINTTGSGVVNAAYYQITSGTPSVTTHNYSTLETAVPAVTAEGNTASKNIRILGTVTVNENIDVPAGVTIDVTGGIKLYIGPSKDGQDVVVTMADGSRMTSRSEQVEVYGTLTFANKANDATVNTISDVTVESEERNGSRTYTNIYTALNEAQPGQTVTVSRDTGVVDITENITVPEGVTLYVPDTAVPLFLENGVTMTVDGTLETELDIYAANEFGTTAANVSGVDGDKSSAIIVNGTMMAPNTTYGNTPDNATMTTFNGTSKTGVAMSLGAPIYGAYYETDDYHVVSSLALAVDAVADAITGITVNGPVTAGDIIFTASEYCDTITVGSDVTVVDMDDKAVSTVLTVGSLTLDGTDVATTYGVLNGDIVVGDARLTVSDVENLLVTDGAADGMIVDNVDTTAATSSAENGGSLTLAAGSATATIMSDVNVIVNVASGATMAMDGANIDCITVDGTVTVAAGDNFTAGELLVQGNGTVTVAAATSTTAPGNASVDTLLLGICYGDFDNDSLVSATEGTATVSGPIDITGTAYVLNGAIIDAPNLEGLNATAFHLNSSVWFTAYAVGDNDSITANKAPVENAVLAGWSETDGGDVITVPDSSDVAETTFVIGDKDNLYAVVNYDIYVINMRADQNAVSSISIDGNIMQFGMIWDETVAGGFYYGYTAVVSAGSHTISYQLANGYSGNGVLTVNGTQQSGLTFTTEGNPEAGQQNVTYNLQLTGFEKSGYVPDSPDTPSTPTSSDDGMTITDYLLIVLVVLIIVMAIIVAMRLMRS